MLINRALHPYLFPSRDLCFPDHPAHSGPFNLLNSYPFGITSYCGVAMDGSVLDPFNGIGQPSLVVHPTGRLRLQFSFVQADDLKFWAEEEDDVQTNVTATPERRLRRRLNHAVGSDVDMQGRRTQEDRGLDGSDNIQVGVAVSNKHKGLDKVLLKDFSAIPKHVDYGDYAVINVSPSVVPAYFPSIRIFNYNISQEAVQEALERKERRRPEGSFKRPPPHGHRKPDPSKSRDKQCKKDKYKDSWRCHFSKDNWHSDPEAPSRKNGLMTPLGFAQVSLEPVDSFLR